MPETLSLTAAGSPKQADAAMPTPHRGPLHLDDVQGIHDQRRHNGGTPCRHALLKKTDFLHYRLRGVAMALRQPHAPTRTRPEGECALAQIRKQELRRFNETLASTNKSKLDHKPI